MKLGVLPINENYNSTAGLSNTLGYCLLKEYIFKVWAHFFKFGVLPINENYNYIAGLSNTLAYCLLKEYISKVWAHFVKLGVLLLFFPLNR